MQKDLLAEDPAKQQSLSVMAAFGWWERKRMLYNLLTGLSGIITLLCMSPSFYLQDIAGILVWGLFANLLYCSGFLLEVFVKHYTRLEINFTKHRPVIFWAGAFFSVLLTAAVAMVFSILIQSSF